MVTGIVRSGKKQKDCLCVGSGWAAKRPEMNGLKGNAQQFLRWVYRRNREWNKILNGCGLGKGRFSHQVVHLTHKPRLGNLQMIAFCKRSRSVLVIGQRIMQ